MSDMIERVARPICAEYGDDYDERPADLVWGSMIDRILKGV